MICASGISPKVRFSGAVVDGISTIVSSSGTFGGPAHPTKTVSSIIHFFCAFCFYRPSNVFHQENKKLPDTSHDATCFPMTEDFSLIK